MLSSRRFLRFTMRYLHDCKNGKLTESYLRLNRRCTPRIIQTANISSWDSQGEEEDAVNANVPDEVKKKLIFSEYLDRDKLKMGYKKTKIINDINQKEEQRENFNKLIEEPVYSVLLNDMLENEKLQTSENESDCSREDSLKKPIHMPYTGTNKYETVEIKTDEVEESPLKKRNELNEEYKALYEKYLESKAARSSNLVERYESLGNSIESTSEFHLTDNLSKVPPDWMTDYEHYDDSLEESNWQLNYGTPKPNSQVSNVQCGGCGALLHCKDSAIPGYLPSEIFLGKKDVDLKSITCQRCHFMKHYNTSLAVNVAPEEYPRLLSSIKNKMAAVILLVDLMDFPCSIWPDILSIIGTKRPVFVVGNKVDLLPKDSRNFCDHITKCLCKVIVETGINKANVKHVSLISAKTGYGIEELINALHNIWEYKGHVYLIGCTNSGKSTLFNALLQSDYCKVQAVDLIQRATISPWPGTTLNLLKFPILRPSGWRLSLRAARLQNDRKLQHVEEKFRREKLNKSKNLKYAQLIGHIGQTFSYEKPVESNDLYAAGSGTGSKQNKFGIDINDRAFKESYWCYDTPGTVQPDQVLHLLTTDELMLTLPKRMIIPRTYCIQPNQTLFLGGLGRLDYFDGDCFIRVTVFASHELPVTVSLTDDASFIYNQLLKTEAFVVPFNSPERLKQWPELKSKDFEITGLGWEVSAADVVLSSAGWMAITPGLERTVNVRAWTPEGRGIYLRTPALLPHSVGLRGKKIRDTPTYYRKIPVYRR